MKPGAVVTGSGLTDLTVKPFREELPADFKLMIVDRNNKWMPQIERMFQTAEDELVLGGRNASCWPGRFVTAAGKERLPC